MPAPLETAQTCALETLLRLFAPHLLHEPFGFVGGIHAFLKGYCRKGLRRYEEFWIALADGSDASDRSDRSDGGV